MDKAQIQRIAIAKAQATWDFFSRRYPQLPVLPPAIVLNARFTSSAGCNISQDRVIKLATKFYIKFPDIMTNVIVPHEVCHQVDYDLNGWYDRKPHHGKPWQNLMVQYGLPPEPYHSMIL